MMLFTTLTESMVEKIETQNATMIKMVEMHQTAQAVAREAAAAAREVQVLAREAQQAEAIQS
jgi:hypothetical protein